MVDMGLPAGVAAWLRQAGYDAVHPLELGLERARDTELFDLASRESRVVVTTDFDFGEIVALRGGSQVSVIICHFPKQVTDRTVHRLEPVLRDEADALRAGCVIIIEPHRYRLRRLPIGPV
ncbi:DUF5615 family PIN-like protein [Desertibaculum subflavum]|uniref:DUF5615 family PIN-like protein n=1 Tax=Desertibaculum subflavum TaxID=2268458 RepID=UPI0013C4453E